jgi:hypothetical protein
MSRPALLALALLSSLACHSNFGAGIAPAVAEESGTDQSVGPGLTVEQARAAADRILQAIKSQDANLRFAQFSRRLKAISSPSMVAETMRKQPKLLSWTLLSVRGGLKSTTVEASLKTSAGTRDLFMVLNKHGELDGYHLDLTDAKATQVASDFVRALSSGHFISARSFLSLPLQEELSPAALQTKWQQLQRYTGNYVAMRRVVAAEHNSDSQLVLVNTEFNRITDTLFVVLNENNEIVSVDFPQDPIQPRAVSTPLR